MFSIEPGRKWPFWSRGHSKSVFFSTRRGPQKCLPMMGEGPAANFTGTRGAVPVAGSTDKMKPHEGEEGGQKGKSGIWVDIFERGGAWRWLVDFFPSSFWTMFLSPSTKNEKTQVARRRRNGSKWGRIQSVSVEIFILGTAKNGSEIRSADTSLWPRRQGKNSSGPLENLCVLEIASSLKKEV